MLDRRPHRPRARPPDAHRREAQRDGRGAVAGERARQRQPPRRRAVAHAQRDVDARPGLGAGQARAHGQRTELRRAEAAERHRPVQPAVVEPRALPVLGGLALRVAPVDAHRHGVAARPQHGPRAERLVRADVPAHEAPVDVDLRAVVRGLEAQRVAPRERRVELAGVPADAAGVRAAAPPRRCARSRWANGARAPHGPASRRPPSPRAGRGRAGRRGSASGSARRRHCRPGPPPSPRSARSARALRGARRPAAPARRRRPAARGTRRRRRRAARSTTGGWRAARDMVTTRLVGPRESAQRTPPFRSRAAEGRIARP